MNQVSAPIVKHKWASGGVSSYPLSHPIVGQGQFYAQFKQFIHVVDQEEEQFAHVFAIIAQWGVGKSRLAYELISQINDRSKGWYVRDEAGSLTQAHLFYDERDREQYLGLYIRYSQIANEHHNIDNWFGYGLYKALLPLAKGHFDGSIQNAIAKEAYERLLVLGFDEKELAKALEIEANHSDQELYEDPDLVTRLCENAYNYLQQFGIKYILVALDELETVAETSTYGLEDRDIKHMDGRAIKLLGKAIKEEDPRRKLPWLRYVALCSPAIGDELREIQSTARRFELVDLAQNAFADVSDFVKTLAHENRLAETYPKGLVEAAYAMSGGNFGWFNVIMANVDGRLQVRRSEGSNLEEVPSLETLFDELVKNTSRIPDYILDSNAVQELLIERQYLPAAKKLLYGQLPVPLNQWQSQELQTLLTGKNEYDEPIAWRYRQVEWDGLACSEALRSAKFAREQGEDWELASVPQPLNLRQLLDNLSTYAIYAHRGDSQDHTSNYTPDGKRILLIPLTESRFIELVSFLYPHPAAEDAARALWQHFIGVGNIPEAEATHIGPSIAMLERLNLRYRKRNQTSLIFRDPEQNNAHEAVMAARKQQPLAEKAREILTGVMRVLDNNWSYDPVSARVSKELIAIVTPRGSRGREQSGLVTCDALKLHPKGRAIFAWVQNEADLERLCTEVSTQFGTEGKTPVLAFTNSRALYDRFQQAASQKLQQAKSYLLLYQLSTNEEYILHRVGLPNQDQQGFELNITRFNTTFTGRINAFQRGLLEEITRWRRRLNQEGWIAWSLRPSGSLRTDEREELVKTWRFLSLETPAPHALYQIDEHSGIDIEGVLITLQKSQLTNPIRAAGYGKTEQAGLFDSVESDATAQFPPFLVQVLERFIKYQGYWSLEEAKKQWFWGYTWIGAKSKNIFEDWLTIAVELGFAVTAPSQGNFNVLSHSTLRNRIQEAENWLKQDYPQIVLKMQQVFGKNKIEELFGEHEGTKTAIAKKKLEIAWKSYKELEIIENEYHKLPGVSSLDAKKDLLLKTANKRHELIEAVNFVYQQEKYAEITDSSNTNYKTLKLDDDQEDLWRRIRRAELFSELVLKIRDKIKKRIDTLQIEIKESTQELSFFPVSLFTLSLEKIRNILDGAIREGTPLGSTAEQQMTDAGALGQCLKDLRVADAMNRLAQLGREVGINVEDSHLGEVAIDQIEGHIMTGFRRFKESYRNLQNQLNDTKERLNQLEKKLEAAPNTFQYPSDINGLEQLKLRPDFIEDRLEDIQKEEANSLREDLLYDRPAKQGNFQPLMQASGSLLQTTHHQIQQLRAHLLTLENAIRGFLNSLLKQQDIQQIEKSFNALLKAKRKQPRPTLNLTQLESAGSLQAAVSLVEERRNTWVQEGNKMLPSSIQFERWQRIVDALEKEQEPDLTDQEAHDLVTEGLLVRTYKLGG